MEEKEVQISVQVTPNPNSLRFVFDRTVVEKGSYNFTSAEKAAGSKLASALFELEGVTGVLICANFVTVTKNPDIEWARMAEKTVGTLKSFISSGQTAVEAGEAEAAAPEGDIEKKIREVLDNEIRPAVARDGGDVVFDSYEDGVVRLYLQGACSSCPSSVMTLKLGIENRLRQVIPEIKEVVSV